MKFYQNERETAGFEIGIRTALQAILASPHFIFRLEEAPATARAGQSYKINDVDLASRLSFFIWGSGPDEELIAAAAKGTLGTPAGLEQQARRMLADPRASALVDALRVAVAAAAGPRQDSPRRAAVSAVRHDARRRDGQGDRSSSSTTSFATTATCSSC